MNLPIYKAQIDPAFTSDLEVNFIGLVDRPAIERNFQAFKDAPQKVKFAINEEKRIISGPAMIADMPLYRKDDQLGEYYVVFDRQAIQSIVEKFSAKGFLKNFNLFHDEQQQVSDVTIFNSFISDKSLGVNPPIGFEDVADGSWFISAKVNNADVWEKVKSGLIKGFSVEGLFTYIPASFAKFSANDLTEDDISFLQGTICNNQMDLQSAVLIGEDSPLYEFAQGIIKKSTAEIAQVKEWLGASAMTFKMSAETARKKIEKILSETDFQ